MDDQRLINIETKVAYQEHLVEELSAIVADQQQRIDRLETRCRSLLERIRALGDGSGAGAGSPDDERPPHY
jgi:SlyX protein